MQFVWLGRWEQDPRLLKNGPDRVRSLPQAGEQLDVLGQAFVQGREVELFHVLGLAPKLDRPEAAGSEHSAAPNSRIEAAADWFKKRPEDTGALIHELAHVIQSYPKYYPVWLVEGIADCIGNSVEREGKLIPLEVKLSATPRPAMAAGIGARAAGICWLMMAGAGSAVCARMPCSAAGCWCRQRREAARQPAE